MEERYLDPEIERLTELYEKDPTARVFAPLADAYRKSRLYDEAIDILKKGLEIHPDYVSAHLVLARCYYEKDMLQLAKDSLERVLELDQQNVVTLRLLGDILFRLGDEEKALARYKEVIEMDPTNLEVQALMEKIVPSASKETKSVPIEPHPVPPEQPPEEKSILSPTHSAEAGEVLPEEALIGEKETPELEKEGTTKEEEARQPVETSFATLTLAEIYEEQGFLEKALEVYEQLLESNPEDEQLKAKVEDLTAKFTPKFEEQIEKTEASFSGLLREKESEGEKRAEDEKEGKKGDFVAFKQWLEGLSKNETIE